MMKALQSVSRTAFLAAFAVACVLFASPALPATGVAPVLSATPGNGEVDLSWTDWTPPDDLPADWMVGATVYYRYRVRVDSEDWSDWTRVDGTSTTVPDLENGKAHTFVVRGYQRGSWPDNRGAWSRYSPESAEVTVTPNE